MTTTLRLGRIAGVEIGLHWSWALIVLLLGWSLAAGVFPETNPGLSDGVYSSMATIAVAAFFTSLLLHELGHARQAERENMEIEGITLWIFGGVARFRGNFPSAGAEFRIAVAGPVVSLLIGLVAIALALALPLPDAVDGVVLWLGEVNLVLLAFNLIPALPLDGGRMLRAALWHRRGDFLSATRRAAALGRGFGQFLIAFGVFAVIAGGAVGGIWLAFIGWFLVGAAEAELIGAETHLALGGLSAGDAMVEEPVTVSSGLSLERFVNEVFFQHRFAAYPVVKGGIPIGLISYREALAVPAAEWSERSVEEVMTPVAELPAVDSDLELEPALERLGASGHNRTLVVRNGEPVGLLSLTDATRIIEARRAALPGRSRPTGAGNPLPGAAGVHASRS